MLRRLRRRIQSSAQLPIDIEEVSPRGMFYEYPLSESSKLQRRSQTIGYSPAVESSYVSSNHDSIPGSRISHGVACERNHTVDFDSGCKELFLTDYSRSTSASFSGSSLFCKASGDAIAERMTKRISLETTTDLKMPLPELRQSTVPTGSSRTAMYQKSDVSGYADHSSESVPTVQHRNRILMAPREDLTPCYSKDFFSTENPRTLPNCSDDVLNAAANEVKTRVEHYTQEEDVLKSSSLDDTHYTDRKLVDTFESKGVCDGDTENLQEDLNNDNEEVGEEGVENEIQPELDYGITCKNYCGFSLEEIEAEVYVKFTEAKGRCLYTRKSHEPGDVIFIEDPVLIAIPSLNPSLWDELQSLNTSQELSLPPIWHLAAICSLTMLPKTQTDIIRNKWTPDKRPPPSNDVLRVVAHCQTTDLCPWEYELFLQAWRFNSFGHHTHSDGLVLYDRISMMAHCCSSSACWHYGRDSAFVLRARQHMSPGDEVNISYIGDEELQKSSHLRREKASSWLFKCMCDRCKDPIDTSRGFKCPSCGIGQLFFKTEEEDIDCLYTTSTACSFCNYLPTEDIITEAVEYENAYIDRLEETTIEDFQDVHLVLEEAKKLFSSQHWVMYSLESLMFEGYKSVNMINEAVFYAECRIRYISAVMPRASFTLSWMLEEVGDLLASKASFNFTDASVLPKVTWYSMVYWYELASNMMRILCGEEHEYFISTKEKLRKVLEAKTTPY